MVLVIQEIFGVHEYIADTCRRFAKAGYLAIAPQLYARQGDASAYTDIAKLMGNIIERELVPGAGIVSIDGIDLKDFDFIDIGQELPDAKAVPVVIKSLIFRHTEHGRGHHHQQH